VERAYLGPLSGLRHDHVHAATHRARHDRARRIIVSGQKPTAATEPDYISLAVEAEIAAKAFPSLARMLLSFAQALRQAAEAERDA
jgi:hypothetical protein